MKKLSNEALQVLGGLKVSNVPGGTLAVITTGHLPPELLVDPAKGLLKRNLYVEVDKGLRALGGAWHKKLGGHLFPDEGALEEALDLVIHTGVVVDAKKAFQFYETPPDLAAKLVQLAYVKPKMLVLEPSAGRGRLVEALWAVEPEARLVLVEKDPKHWEKLTEYANRIDRTCLLWRGASFLDFTSATLFDRVLMNPPFTKQQDAIHVRHAYGLLKPGGRLVAIMSAAVNFRETDHYRWVREHASEINDNPKDAFKASGTLVRTVTVVIDKP